MLDEARRGASVAAGNLGMKQDENLILATLLGSILGALYLICMSKFSL